MKEKIRAKINIMLLNIKMIRSSLREKNFWINFFKFKNFGCFSLLFIILFSGQIIREFGWFSVFVFIVIFLVYLSGFTDGYEVNNS
jgi:hypothetical protein